MSSVGIKETSFCTKYEVSEYFKFIVWSYIFIFCVYMYTDAENVR
jgi:hypothetical protein